MSVAGQSSPDRFNKSFRLQDHITVAYFLFDYLDLLLNFFFYRGRVQFSRFVQPKKSCLNGWLSISGRHRAS